MEKKNTSKEIIRKEKTEINLENGAYNSIINWFLLSFLYSFIQHFWGTSECQALCQVPTPRPRQDRETLSWLRRGKRRGWPRKLMQEGGACCTIEGSPHWGSPVLWRVAHNYHQQIITNKEKTGQILVRIIIKSLKGQFSYPPETRPPPHPPPTYTAGDTDWETPGELHLEMPRTKAK